MKGIDGPNLTPDERDLRYRTVAVATILGESFPFYDPWRRDALRDNWGWAGVKQSRLADEFLPDQPGPKSGGNGRRY